MKSVKLGLSPKQMATIIGQPVAVRQPKDVVENYLMLDINPDTRLLMHSEFDKQMEYSPLNNRKDYPVFTVYYKNDKAVYIIFSSYIYPLHRLENIYIKKHMAFGNIATLLNAIGENYEYAPINNYDGEYLYLQKGISLISENDLVRAIHLYRPLKKNEAIEFMKLRRQ
ncbi:MAG: hypothetical protein JJT94_05600 [Bernardetiaceae bacterium]|nr:hypothetical protein [Bernardetiaceae bacterium]